VLDGRVVLAGLESSDTLIEEVAGLQLVAAGDARQKKQEPARAAARRTVRDKPGRVEVAPVTDDA